MNNHDKDLSLNQSIHVWKNIPLDSRSKTPSLNEIDDYIHYPYKGMIFYSDFEDTYYKVISTESGYRTSRCNDIYRASQLDNLQNYIEIPKYFIGKYEKLTFSNSSSSSPDDLITIKNIYIDESGILHIIMSDGTDFPAGNVEGKGPKGDKGEKGEDGLDGKSAYEIAKENGFTGTEIEWLTSLKGDKGEQGEIGPQGEQGIQGIQGEKGQDGTNGISAYEIAIKNGFEGTEVEWLESLKGDKGIQGDKGESGQNGSDGKSAYEIALINGFDGSEAEWLESLKGEQGLKGENGKGILNILKTSSDGNIDTYTITYTDETTSTFQIINGKEIELRNNDIAVQWKYTNETEWIDLFTIESITGSKGDKGEPGQNGLDGKSIEIGTITTNTIESNENANVIIEPIEKETIISYNFTFNIPKGEKGLDGEQGLNGEDGYSPTIIENINNTEDIYKLDISYKDSEGILQSYTTPNLKGDKGTASNFIICEELPSIEIALLDTIYLLKTPQYQRGLNIGLTDDVNANKNHFEEWIVIENNDGTKNWELLSPQLYRISEKMIDYIWKVRNDYTVYDDWSDTTDISDYQKEYGDITPLSNFVYRIEGSELILVKYIGVGDVYLNIAPRYKIGDKVYTVTELDGTYYPEKTYYQIDSNGNVTNYTFDTELFKYDDNGVETTQTLLTGPQVYSLYIADTVTKLTRVLINTSNIPKYHIPSGIETIGDYAFYSSANQTMVFEKLSADGKTAIQVGFESSNIKYIGEYGCACTTNMRMINDSGKDVNYLTTPASLKKISNHAFYRAGQIAHVDTRKSSNLYIGKEAFTRANLSAVQYLSPTTYYTDNSFLGYTELYHNSRLINGGGLYFYDNNTIGYNYNDINHTEASETAKLNVTLTTIDPVFE